MIPYMNGFVYRLLRKTAVLRTFQTPLVLSVSLKHTLVYGSLQHKVLGRQTITGGAIYFVNVVVSFKFCKIVLIIA